MPDTITAIMTGYRRPHNLPIQLEAIRNQTRPPQDIFLWYNKADGEDGMWACPSDVKAAYCNHNFKYHGRFAMGFLARTDYVCIFDDDTIPGPRWFESCLATVAAGFDGIIGTSGITLKTTSYTPYFNTGWNATPGVPRDRVVETDLLGHSWFFRKEYLKFMFYEEPVTWNTCEDIQLSAMAQKYGGLRTYTPPHPLDDKDIWGSIDGQRLGTDEVAISMQHLEGAAFMDERGKAACGYMAKGWKPLFMREEHG